MTTLHSAEDYDSAILILTKGDEVHVRTTENLSPMEFMELLLAVSLDLEQIITASDDAINRMIQ